MVKTRGVIHAFGGGKWRARVLGQNKQRNDLKIRSKGATHFLETNVAVEKKCDDNDKWCNKLKLNNGKRRDDVRFSCSALSANYIYLHHFVFYLTLGRPLTKKSYDAWRAHCREKKLEIDHIDQNVWRVTTSNVQLIKRRSNREKQ